jgi:antitoxin component YwqK of YwqJK toxin-antitoxin module
MKKEPSSFISYPNMKTMLPLELWEKIMNDNPKTFNLLSRTCKTFSDLAKTLTKKNKKRWSREVHEKVNGTEFIYTILPNGIKEGTCLEFREDGTLKSKYRYINGKIVGNYIKYFPDGTIKAVYSYKNGRRHGECIFFNPATGFYSQDYYYHGISRELSLRCFYYTLVFLFFIIEINLLYLILKIF